MRKRDEPAYPAAGIQNHEESLPVGGLTKLEYTAIQVHMALFGRYQLGQSEALAKTALAEANALWDELEKEPSK